MPWWKSRTHKAVDKPVDAVDNQRQKNTVLGIYAKQPSPGQCKTRLSPPLSLTEAAELYRCSLQETVERMQTGCGYDLVICYAGERSWFEQVFPGVPWLHNREPTWDNGWPAP